MSDIGRQKRDVVGVVAFPGAYPATPFCVRQLFVGRDFAFFHPLFRRENKSCTERQPVPKPVRIAIRRRDGSGQGRGFYRLRETCFDDRGEPPDIGGEYQVRGAVTALGLKTLDQSFAREHHIDLHAGFFGEGVE